MMTMQQEVEAGWRRISELEAQFENLLQENKGQEEELDLREIKIDNLEEEVEKLKDLLEAYKAEAEALRKDNDDLEAQLERLK